VESNLPSIMPDGGSFDDEITRTMGGAFNGAVKLLRAAPRSRLLCTPASQLASLRWPVAVDAMLRAWSKQV